MCAEFGSFLLKNVEFAYLHIMFMFCVIGQIHAKYRMFYLVHAHFRILNIGESIPT